MDNQVDAPADEDARREGVGTFSDINGGAEEGGACSLGALVAALNICWTSVRGVAAADGGGQVGGGGSGRDGGGGGGGSSWGATHLVTGAEAAASMSSTRMGSDIRVIKPQIIRHCRRAAKQLGGILLVGTAILRVCTLLQLV